MILFEKVPLLPLRSFDNARCRRRGTFDREHAVLRQIIGREFAGAAERPKPETVYEWLVADARSPHERAWCAETLIAASADPWFSLRAMVSEDAVSIYDMARVCDEDGCQHARLTDWLNHYADQPAEELWKLIPPAWALEGLRLTEHGYYAKTEVATRKPQ